MLLRIGIENLWSIRDRTELSFVGTALKDEPAALLPHPAAPHGLLPVLALYGANASGKSNLIKAIELLTSEVQHSFKRDIGAPIARTPFLLRKQARAQPSRLDVDFSHGEDRLHYGFVFDDQRFIEEWLYLWRGRTQRKTVLFHRQGEDKRDWTFSAALEGPNRRIADATRDECLFFSKAAAEDHPKLKGWHQVFLEALWVDRVELTSESTHFHIGRAPVLLPENRALVRRLLAAADLGITDLRVQDPDHSRVVLLQRLAALGLPASEMEKVSSVLTGMGDTHVIELGHQGEDGLAYLSPELESLGTQSLLGILSPVLSALKEGSLLVLDELGSGLHPRLVAELVGLFTSPASNPRGAQLLFTTHDSLIMDQLRRDEILLVDKGRDGASTVRALSDLALRKRDDWRRLYELGLVGGLPAPERLSDVLAEPEDSP